MKPFNPKILRYESLASTNTEAARLALQGGEEGLSVVADEQTAGRGRLQRTWVSPKGAGLYFSILLRPTIPLNQWSLMPFMAALGVGGALLAASGLPNEIKRPHYIFSRERKKFRIFAEKNETDSGRA